MALTVDFPSQRLVQRNCRCGLAGEPQGRKRGDGNGFCGCDENHRQENDERVKVAVVGEENFRQENDEREKVAVVGKENFRQENHEREKVAVVGENFR